MTEFSAATMGIDNNRKKLEEPKGSYESMNIRLPKEQALDLYRDDPTVFKGFSGLCYSPQTNGPVRYEGFGSRREGTGIVVCPHIGRLKRLLWERDYDFFIMEEAGEELLEGISAIINHYRGREIPAPPISVVGGVYTKHLSTLVHVASRNRLRICNAKTIPGQEKTIDTCLAKFLK